MSFPPGGPRGIQARLIGPKLTEAWGQPVVIDNRAGANGTIGLELAAKSPADGHTLVMISSGFAAAPSLYTKLPLGGRWGFRDATPSQRSFMKNGVSGIDLFWKSNFDIGRQ